jgi:hypothetical protein
VHPWNFQLGLPMITSAFAANPSFLQSGICLETNNNAHVRARCVGGTTRQPCVVVAAQLVSPTLM